jgi:hypothetical protein
MAGAESGLRIKFTDRVTLLPRSSRGRHFRVVYLMGWPNPMSQSSKPWVPSAGTTQFSSRSQLKRPAIADPNLTPNSRATTHVVRP